MPTVLPLVARVPGRGVHLGVLPPAGRAAQRNDTVVRYAKSEGLGCPREPVGFMFSAADTGCVLLPKCTTYGGAIEPTRSWERGTAPVLAGRRRVMRWCTGC